MRIATLCASATLMVIGLMAASPALSQDPLVSHQEWLPRIVNTPLPTLTRPVPPIAIIERGFDDEHPEMAGGWIQQRRYGPPPDLSSEAGVVDFASSIAQRQLRLHGRLLVPRAP